MSSLVRFRLQWWVVLYSALPESVLIFYPIPLADRGPCLCICECYTKTVIVFFYALIGICGILIFDASWIICYLLFPCVRCSLTFVFPSCPGSGLLLVVTLAEYLCSCLRVCVVVAWSELRLDRWHRAVSGRDPSVGALSYYCFEYYIWFNCKFIIDLVTELSFSVYIELLYRVHHLSFSSYMYYIFLVICIICIISIILSIESIECWFSKRCCANLDFVLPCL